MKGLLLKDWYMMKKYCRSYLLIAVVFFVLSLAGEDDPFFVFYPCLLCGMIPVSLLGYDERSRWIHYSGTLPYTKAQIVSAKYLIGLFTQVAVLIVTGVLHGIRMYANDSFMMNDLIMVILLMMFMTTITPSICLPFVFKLGVERGRMAYYVMIGFACAGSVLASSLFFDSLHAEIQPNTLLVILALAGIGIYALSWYLSIVFYKKREI